MASRKLFFSDLTHSENNASEDVISVSLRQSSDDTGSIDSQSFSIGSDETRSMLSHSQIHGSDETKSIVSRSFRYGSDETKSIDSRSVRYGSDETKSIDSRSFRYGSDETRSMLSHSQIHGSDETKSIDSRSFRYGSDETKSINSRSVRYGSDETKSIDSRSVKYGSDETTSIDSRSVKYGSDETKSIDSRSVRYGSDETKSIDSITKMKDALGKSERRKKGTQVLSSVFEMCDIHEGKLLDFYCANHNVSGCSVCMKLTHGSCKDVQPRSAQDVTKVTKQLETIVIDEDKNKEFSSDSVYILVDDNDDENKIECIKNEYPQPTPIFSDKVCPAHSWLDDIDLVSYSYDQNEGIVEYTLETLLKESKKPKPAKKLQRVSFTDIDTHAKRARDTVLDSFSDLTKYLTSPIHDDKHKELLTARAIVVWLSVQDLENSHVSGSPSLDTPRGILKLLQEKRMTYSTCYTILCRQANLQCVLIDGAVKAASYEPGDKSAPHTSWTAVHVDGSWQIVHPFWICRALYGDNLGGWVKIEVDDATIAQREHASKGVTRNTFQEHYFMPDPEEFVYKCFATDVAWQLLPKEKTIMSEEEFLIMPYFLPPFFGLGLTLVSETRCLLNVAEGKCHIEFKARPAHSHNLVLAYELFVQDAKYTKEENMSRMVFNSRSNEFFIFDIRFPKEGTYKFVVYGGPFNAPQIRLCEFKIICTRRMENYNLLPLDCSDIGWGPGPEAINAGLLMPSRPSGLIMVPTRNNKIELIKINFMIHPDFVTKNEYTAILTDGKEKTANEKTGFKKYINTSVDERSKLLIILVDLSKGGEFGVSIISCKSGTNNGRKVCNYLLTTIQQPFARANTTIARYKLEEVMNYDVQALRELTPMEIKIKEVNERIQRCEKERIPPSDEQLSDAKTRLEYLSCKYLLRLCIARGNLDVATKTLKWVSRYQYKSLFTTMIEKIEQLRAQLEELHQKKQN